MECLANYAPSAPESHHRQFCVVLRMLAEETEENDIGTGGVERTAQADADSVVRRK